MKNDNKYKRVARALKEIRKNAEVDNLKGCCCICDYMNLYSKDIVDVWRDTREIAWKEWPKFSGTINFLCRE